MARGSGNPRFAGGVLLARLHHLHEHRWLGIATNSVAWHFAPALLGIDGFQRNLYLGGCGDERHWQLVYLDVFGVFAQRFCFHRKASQLGGDLFDVRSGQCVLGTRVLFRIEQAAIGQSEGKKL